MGQFLFVAIVCLILFVAFLLVFQLVRGEKEDRTLRSLGLEARFALGLARPLLALIIQISRSLGFDHESAIIRSHKSRLDAAGIAEMDGEELLASRTLMGLVLGAATFLLMLSMTGTPFSIHVWIGAAATFYIGLLYPVFKVDQRGTARRKMMQNELPYVLDLMSLAIEAGLDFKTAMERLVAFSDPSPLMEELKLFLQDLELGATMEEALQKMGERIDVLAFFQFVESLIQATQLGIDVSSTLRAQAEQMRVVHFQDMEKAAQATPMLILFPTVFCIFPPLLIILMAPLVIKFKSIGMIFSQQH